MESSLIFDSNRESFGGDEDKRESYYNGFISMNIKQNYMSDSESADTDNAFLQRSEVLGSRRVQKRSSKRKTTFKLPEIDESNIYTFSLLADFKVMVLYEKLRLEEYISFFFAFLSICTGIVYYETRNSPDSYPLTMLNIISVASFLYILSCCHRFYLRYRIQLLTNGSFGQTTLSHEKFTNSSLFWPFCFEMFVNLFHPNILFDRAVLTRTYI